MRFLAAHRELIRGDVLECGSGEITLRSHTGAVSLTVVGDGIGAVPEAAYDCVILDGRAPTAAVVRAAHLALRPGGAMFAAASDGVWIELRSLLQRQFGEGRVDGCGCSGEVAILATKAPAATTPARRRREIQGHVDQATCRLVKGWAWDSAAPEQRLRVEVWSGGSLLGEAWACRYRPDLETAGKGDGTVGFSLEIDPPLHGLPLPELAVIVVDGEQPLTGSPTRAVCRCPGRAASAQPLAGSAIDEPAASDLPSFPWLKISGWAVGGEAPVSSVELSHGGTVFGTVAVSSPRPALASLFESLPWAPNAGFDATVNLLATGPGTEIDIEAVLWNGERAPIGRIGGGPNVGPLPVTILLSPAGATGAIPALGQDTPVQAVVAVRPGMPVGHPGVSTAHGWNLPLGIPRTLVWCSDGDEHVTPSFLRACAAALEREPSASFAVASERPLQAPPELPAVLSGSALGSALLIRASAIRSVGGLDEAADSAAFAQWDIAIRLAEVGHTWVEVPEATANATPLRQRLGENGAAVLYRKHAALYGRHLSDVLLDLEGAVAEQLAARTELARTIDGALAPRVRARRRERDRLTSRQRQVWADASSTGRYWGDFLRLDPLGPFRGTERGIAIDRLYTERFLDRHAGDVRGSVLEYGGGGDAELFGGERVIRCDVVDPFDPATGQAYNCILMMGVLHLAADPRAVLADCAGLLAPGGVLLVSAPCAAALDRDHPSRDRWRFSAESLRKLLTAAFPAGSVEVANVGNRRTVLAQLSGLSAHDLDPEIIETHNPQAPLILTARASVPQ
jgi:SAM-dependent methyltransferase